MPRSIRVDDVRASGGYIAPSLKAIVWNEGLAFVLRYEIFLSGDLAHRAFLGLELGRP